ncbi:uncharacterized protein LOC18430116 [Amborella trichopoda]|uniref:uncharacterized protein LOC18430116 n=1 Tax=Amborella trichopoda TaxID=13333 RepID=UPI0005D2F327|nr:uncharacterized protein LOC18430116 [Amborella trichopoda]|eukprot:XP_006840341.2 uncharacterized protein LOC18430116 [Amborella trichopoda]
MKSCVILVFLVFKIVVSHSRCDTETAVLGGERKLGKGYVSAVGDPGMTRDGLRLGLEAWNFCNEVGEEAPKMGSPRAADCFDISASSLSKRPSLLHKVTEADNKLSVGGPFEGASNKAMNNTDLYAVEKELYLGSKCEVADTPNPWQFWMVMLKNGNFDTKSGLCPQNGKKVGPFDQPGRFPCFGHGCMNQPLLNHEYTSLSEDMSLRGSFNGSYDLDANLGDGFKGISFFEVIWEKKIGVGSWAFKHRLKTSKKYPWLMLYLRADATKGFSGGYHYETRGMLKTIPESPNFKVRLTLDVKQGGGPKSQFYLLDMGSCWKNNGAPCDGDPTTDVTRYSEMILNPETPAWCSPTNLGACPPFHILPNNAKIFRNDTQHFPYSAYHYYCSPGNAEHLEQPSSTCDPYSNPQAQELVQILPHPVWAEYGYPSKRGEGWVGDSRTWVLDVGGLSSRLYFYQDPGTPPAKREWPSIDVGTEMFITDNEQVAEWTLINKKPLRFFRPEKFSQPHW